MTLLSSISQPKNAMAITYFWSSVLSEFPATTSIFGTASFILTA